MLNLKQLRDAAGGLPDLTDEEIISTAYPAYQKYYPTVDHFAQEVGYSGAGRGQWGNRVSGSIDSYQAGMYGIGEALGAGDWARQGRERNESSAAYARQRAQEQGAISSYKDIGGVGDAANYVGGLAVDSAPYLGEAMVGGGLGGLAARGAGAGVRSLARTGGAIGASYPSSLGDILQNQREQAGVTDLGSAAALAVPYAGLNAFGIEGGLARMGGYRSAINLLDDATGVRGAAGRMAMSGLQTAGVEGASEVGQEFINQAGRNAVDPRAGYFGPEAMDRYGESFVGGAALGGVFGSAGGGWRRSEGYQPKNLLQDEPEVGFEGGPPPMLGYNQRYEPPGGFGGYAGQTPFVTFPDGSTSTQADMEIMQRYGMTPDTLGGVRAGVPRVDPTMASPDLSPYLPGKMIADQGGMVALDGKSADSLYGETAGDPGLAEARRRYVEEQGKREATQRQIDEAAQRNRQNRIEAESALLIKNEDGSLPLKLNPREINTFAALRALRDQGTISDQSFAQYAGTMKEALQADDKKALNEVAKTVEELRRTAPKPTKPAATPTVPAGAPTAAASRGVPHVARTVTQRPAAVAPGPAGQPRANPAGSSAAVGRVSADAQRGVPNVAGEPVGRGAAPVPVGVQAPGGNATAVATPAPVATPASTPGTAVIGGQIDFALLNQAVPDPRIRKAVRLHLGVDEDGNRVKPLSMKAAAAAAKLGDNSHERVSKTLKALGITKEVRNKFHASDRTVENQPDAPVDEEVASAEDTSPRLAEEVADEGDTEDVTLADQGITAISSAGGTKSDTDAPARGVLQNQPWYPKKDLASLSMQDFAQLVYRARNYFDSPDSRAAMQAVYQEAAARVNKSPAAFEAAYHAAEYKLGKEQANDNEVADADVSQPAEDVEEVRAEAGTGEGSQAGVPEAAAKPTGERKARVVAPGTLSKKVWKAASTTGFRVEEATADNRTTPEKLAEQYPHIGTAFRALQSVGLGKALGYVESWHLNHSDRSDTATAWVESIDGRYAITLRPGIYRSQGETAAAVAHEVGHAVDQVAHGGVYSSQPEMSFHSGAVFKELERLWKTNDLFHGLLSYPFDIQEEIGNPYVLQAEVFAQLFSYYANPKIRLLLQLAAPNSTAFMKRVIQDVQSKEPRKFHNRIWAQADASRFGQAQPAVAQGLRGEGPAADAPGDLGRSGAFASGRLAKTPEQLIAEAENANKLADKAIDRIRSRMSPKAKDGMATVVDKLRSKFPWFLTNYQLAAEFGKKIASLKTFVGLQQNMTVERTKLAEGFHNIAVEWDKLAKQPREALHEVMLQATLQQIHPDLPFDHVQHRHLDASKRAAYDALASKYNALTPAAKKVYQDAKAQLKGAWAERKKAYSRLVDYTVSKRIEAALERGDMEAVDKIRKDGEDAQADYDKQLKEIEKGPYFPLMRFGDHLAIGESAELIAVKAQLKEATGEQRQELQEQLESMRKDGKHYVVSGHETKGAANAAEREYKARGMEARQDMFDQHLDGMRALSTDTLDHITHVIDAQFDPGVAGQLNEAMSQIFLRSLPEMHALRREAHRRGIEGASTDMLRAFASSGQQNAFYTSRLMFASELADTLFQMKGEVKGKSELQHIHREVEKRVALDMQYKHTPMQDAVSSLSWVYHLGISPSFMLINSTQPWLITGPMLAGRFGVPRSTGALKTAAMDALKILRAARWKNGKWDPWSGISENTLTEHEERKAIRELMNKGIVDEGQQHDINMFADDTNRHLTKFNRVVGWTTQQIELSNRLTSALAAFRLARKTMSYDAAVTYAYETTLNSQFDYSAEGTARFMREGGGVPLAKLMFQFRRYQQGVLYLLGTNIRKSFGEGAEAKEARKILAYLSLSSGLSAGVLGMPFMGTALAMASMFMDDDDPEGDAETRLRNLLLDVTGDKDVADVFAKGIPAFFGADLSARIGLGDVASPFPIARFDGRTGTDQVGQVLVAALGPAAGMTAKFYDGYLRFAEGDWSKGVEKITPKAVADMFKASRYGKEGMTDGNGAPTGTELDGWDVVYRALGVAPTTESNYYEGTRAVKTVEDAVKTRMGRVGRAYKDGVRTGDLAKAREMIEKFNADHPENPIKPKQELTWRREVSRDGKNRDEGSGVRMGKSAQPYADVARFATQ
jgi:hypothetical protein